MPLTEEQVFQAAEQIRDDGRSPSAISIREITQTGSLGTIQKHLRKWRHRETVSASSNNPPPEEVLHSIRDFGERLWHLALQASDRAALQKVRLARDDQDEAIRDMEEALKKLDQAHAEVEDLEVRHEKDQQGKEHLEKELQLRQDLVERASLKCHQLESELQHKKEHLKQVLHDKERLEQVQLQLQKDLEASAQERSELKLELRGLQQNLEHVQQELHQARELSSVQDQEHGNTRRKLDECSFNLQQLQKEKSTWQEAQLQHEETLGALRQELQSQKAECESTRLLNIKLEQLLDRLQATPHESRQN